MSDTGSEPGPALDDPDASDAKQAEAGQSEAGQSEAGQADATGQAEAEQAELERLRAEVARLQSQQPAQARRRRHRLGWRLPVATLLIVLGCVLAPVSVLAVWSANQVSDTSRYVANIEPLIHEPAIQNALTNKVTVQITSQAQHCRAHQ